MLDRTRHFDTPRHHAMQVPRTMFAAAIDRWTRGDHPARAAGAGS